MLKYKKSELHRQNSDSSQFYCAPELSPGQIQNGVVFYQQNRWAGIPGLHF